MDAVLTVLFIICAALAASLHLLSVFLNGVGGKIAGYTNIAAHVALYMISSMRFRDLRITVLIIMSSVLLYLVLSAVRVKFFGKSRHTEEVADDV